ncbi:MAG: helix-turn-helix DNA-binding protein XRE family [Syntrophaceae bacterium]|nr:MAG: helix-turn-helix DNA-binding protein XRE family [Syntrophaceae bacterium]
MQKIMNEKKTLLGRRIRTLRNMKGWTQEELGKRADVNYKFIGEIERGRQNPSLNILYKIATAMQVDLPELFRSEHEIFDRKELETRILRILKKVTDEELRHILLVLNTLYPIV